MERNASKQFFVVARKCFCIVEATTCTLLMRNRWRRRLNNAERKDTETIFSY